MPNQVNIKNIKTEASKINQKLLSYTSKENSKKRFGIGNPVSRDEFLHTFMIYDKIVDPICDVSNFTEKVIKEGTDKSRQYYNKTKIKTLYVVSKDVIDTNEVLDLDCVSEIEW